MSYGTYIYWWPSKYQWVFWPWTDSPSVYLCKKCHLATFLGDFDTLPKDKLQLIQKELEKVPFAWKFKEYTEVPMSERLEIAEKIYMLLPDHGDSFWNLFYRMKGYHYGQEKQSKKATESRTKALLYISGAMKHLLNDDKGAVEDFKKGLATNFVDPNTKPDEIKNAENGMNERFNDYIKQIESPKPPRSTELNQ